MTQGVSIATKKDGTVYYRAGLYYKNKHISLGSYADETTAGNAYLEALAIRALWISCRKIILSSPQPSPLKKSSCF